MSAFTGFSPDTFAFLADLKAHNKRSWFEANRDRYEEHWKAPALAFVETIASGVRALDPPLKASPAVDGSLRRINRDIRFSADKTPYDANMHVVFWAGDHPNRSAGFHFVLTPEGIGYGAGQWSLDADVLKRYRKKVLDSHDRGLLLTALKEAEAIGCFMDEPHLKRMPSGYQGSPEWNYLLRYKGIVARTMEGALMPGWIGTPGAVDEILARARHLSPLIAWLNAV
ncbi:MAG: DUF2461 domain-containing protein [Rhodobacteraceae bacterium]|nr:DUF2461 domain-containing protein [Paracoccaceae bacterium]MCP5340629.1 DUF2461 domain-containing protein [Paracoccaceae bacterium]